MPVKKTILLFSFLCFSLYNIAFARITRGEYISLHKEDAIKDMKRSGIPASITLAQALFESDDGNSPLAREANNHFGIKCTSDWTGPSYTQDDDRRNECFRKYKSVLQSYEDHSSFLKTRPRYAFLFQLRSSDYKEWAKGLKKSGYATNPKYADQLIKIIEDFQLYKLDANNDNELTASASGSSNQGGYPSSENHIDENSKPVYKPISSYQHPKTESNYINAFNASRTMMLNNGIPCIIAKKGDTYEKIAKEYEIMSWMIYKYNDASKGSAVVEGQIVYIKPKHRKADQDFYIVKEGDTMQSISQQFGIKMKLLYKKNNMEQGTQAQAGQKLWLNKKKS